jgi:hypothetical protein
MDDDWDVPAVADGGGTLLLFNLRMNMTRVYEAVGSQLPDGYTVRDSTLLMNPARIGKWPIGVEVLFDFADGRSELRMYSPAE